MFSDEELNDILRLLSAVLHLGNLKFQGKYKLRISYMKLINEYFSNHHTKYGHMHGSKYHCTSSCFEIVESKHFN